MSLRVILGESLVRKYTNQQTNQQTNLNTVYCSDKILIQGCQKTKVIKDEGSVSAVFQGYVLGKKNNNGWLVDLNANDLNFSTYINNNSVELLKNDLEGRFLLIKIGKDGCLKICPDKYGQMDCYYRNEAKGSIFATSLDLLDFDKKNRSHDQVGLAHSFYVYGFRPGKRQTLYKEVSRLGVGQLAIWKDACLKVDTVPFEYQKIDNSYGDEQLEEYAHILHDAIEKRSSPDGNVVYLSSGWDSTSILAHLVKIHGANKVSAIIGRMNFSDRRGVINQFELDRAQAFADHFGIKLEIVEYDYFKRGSSFLEEMAPFLSSHMLSGMSVYFWDDLARYISKHHKGKAIFCGEISDGVHNFGFAQYASILNHPDLGFREYADKMSVYLFGPSFLKALQEGNHKKDSVYKFMTSGCDAAIFDASNNSTSNILRQSMASLFLRDKRLPLWSINNSNLFTEYGRNEYTDTMEKLYLGDLAEKASNENVYSCYQHLYNSFHWQGGTVSSLSFTANKYGFDIMLPFYDSRLQDFLAKMPEAWGRGLELRPAKYPLKWTLQNKLDYPMHLQKGPHSYLYDIDPNFSHAGEFIYASSFTPFMKEQMKKRKYREVLDANFLNVDYFDKIVSNYLSDKEIPSERGDLSALIFLTLSNWC